MELPPHSHFLKQTNQRKQLSNFEQTNTTEPKTNHTTNHKMQNSDILRCLQALWKICI